MAAIVCASQSANPAGPWPSSRRRIDRRFLFHVKHLLPDAEVAEDHVEDILDIDPAGDASESACGQPELLRDQILFSARPLLDRAAQRLDGFSQRPAVSRS